jgi:hypothetical protein
MKKSLIYIATIAIASATLLGCTTTGSVTVTGKKRPAISPNEVTLYTEPPAQFETIGLIEVQGSMALQNAQNAQNRAINELKKRAAKVGANGVLLTNTERKLSLGSPNTFLQGKAIYVIKE